ncbi:MAG TPA: hypothetical protein VJA87_01130 [Candidatus Paceibacterota bacterium]
MSGGRINVASFDGTKKMDWFRSDIGGVLFAMLPVAIGVWLFIGLCHAVASLDRRGTLLLIVGASLVIAFVIVFCLRRNWTVIGEPRKFRYFCRWL